MTMTRAWLAGLALALVACGSDNGGDVVDGGFAADSGEHKDAGGDCSTLPTFTSIHATVIANVRCATCHGAAGAPAGGGSQFSADDKAAAYAALLGDTLDPSRTPAKRVTPGQPSQSSFYLKLTDNPPFGTKMPQAFPELTDCELAAIETWISNGAAND